MVRVGKLDPFLEFLTQLFHFLPAPLVAFLVVIGVCDHILEEVFDELLARHGWRCG